MARKRKFKDDDLEDDVLRESSMPTEGLQETTTAVVVKKGRSGGGAGLGKYREQMRCSMCNNPMTMTKGIHVQEVKGKKIPRGLDGRALWESPGVAKGKMAGVLCDDCLRFSKTSVSVDGKSSGVDIKTVVAVRKDGSVSMVKVADLA